MPLLKEIQPGRGYAFIAMAQRRFHYEQAFEHYLRANRIPYVAVDEAKKALIAPAPSTRPDSGKVDSLKSFDFVVYSPNGNYLIDVKGRKCRVRSGSRRVGGSVASTGHLETWVTRDDVDSLSRWESLFGTSFVGQFVFVYWCETQPPDALFQEVFTFGNRWYALRSISLVDYRGAMRVRSVKWDTLFVPADRFRELSEPFRAHRTLTADG